MVEALLAFFDEFVPAATDPEGDSPTLVASP